MQKTLQGLLSTCAKNPVPKFTRNVKEEYDLVLCREFNAHVFPILEILCNSW